MYELGPMFLPGDRETLAAALRAWLVEHPMDQGLSRDMTDDFAGALCCRDVAGHVSGLCLACRATRRRCRRTRRMSLAGMAQRQLSIHRTSWREWVVRSAHHWPSITTPTPFAIGQRLGHQVSWRPTLGPKSTHSFVPRANERGRWGR
jgi:hypothetical protein